MDRHRLILSLKQEVRDLYRQYSLSLVGLFNIVVQGRKPGNAAYLDEELYRLRESFGMQLSQMITRHAQQIRGQAEQNAIADLKVKQSKSFLNKLNLETGGLDQIIDDIYFRLSAQASLDSASISRAYQRHAIKARSSQLLIKSAQSANPDVLMRGTPAPDMKFIDRAGRRWNVDRYIDVTVGWVYFRYYNEIYLMGRVIRRRKTASVLHRDENHRNSGMRFPIVRASVSDPAPYDEIMDTVFHPNSNAMVYR